MTIEVNTKVQCLSNSIDRNIGKGMIGRVTGFARFSSYHQREAFVQFEDGKGDWFWVNSLAPTVDPLDDFNYVGSRHHY